MSQLDRKNFSELTGSANPENGDYLAGLRADQLDIRQMSDQRLQLQIDEMLRNGQPSTGTARAGKLATYQTELRARQSVGVQISDTGIMHHRV